MSQKLILPINNMKVTANYLNAKYKTQFGYTHYGIDAVSTDGKTPVYALGDGTVFDAGQDGVTLTGTNSRLGNCIVVVYKDVLCNDGKTRNLACRMFHFASLAVKKGNTVKAGTLIGQYGNTGANSTGAHLHLEFDTDINYPQYAYGVAGGNIIKRGPTNSTVNPSIVWYRGKGQTIIGWGDGYTSDADVNIPTLEPEQDNTTALKNEIGALKAENEELRLENELMKKDIAALYKKFV